MTKSIFKNRKTFNVYFTEKDSGIKSNVVLNAWNKADLKKEFKHKFKGWKIDKLELH